MPSLRVAEAGRRGVTFSHRPWLWVVGAWLLCCAAMLWMFRNEIPTLGFHDPDDAMRLQQVRDWIGGQAWFDVSQHRVNPPLGGPMHWSRIVDMPIAAVILLTGPIIGKAGAEIVACVTVPLLLLGALTGFVHLAARRIGGQNIAFVSVLLLLTAPSILIQFTPLRIDHHGWQIAMAALALAGLYDPRPVRGGLITGLALAIWLQISSECLPYAALFGAVLALYQWVRPAQTKRFVVFAAALGGLALPLLLLLRGWSAAITSHCDALSAAYVWPLVALAVVTPLAFLALGTRTALRRMLIAGIGGSAALAVFAITGGSCLSGDPFQSLGPVAYKLWYIQVMEGRPIWEQDVPRMGSILLPPLAGLLGTAMAACHARADRDERDKWLLLIILLAGSTAVAMMVMRALSVAHVMALPGIAWLIIRLFQRVQASRLAVVRVFGSVALMLLTPAGLCALWIGATSGPAKTSANTAADGGGQCQAGAAMTALAPLPTGTVFAPMDVGPTILLRTGDSVIATGHHRNAAGITAVIRGFRATPDEARGILARLNGGRGVDYVVTCTDLNEFKIYAERAPHSLAAALNAGRIPAWLQPLPGTGSLHVYKVQR